VRDDLLAQARDLVLLEGWLLDTRDWDRWLDLYSPKATYWLPIWLEEDRYTSDPQNEMSLIYYNNRTGLEDRIFRIRTEQSLASSPLPRTCHMTSVVEVAAEGETIKVNSCWTVHSYRLEKAHTFFGHQTHMLEIAGTGLRINSRKVIVANDVIPNVLDVYSV
jgi:3-phenylpropionate/cinnamic acid dioxygenase small subunit